MSTYDYDDDYEGPRRYRSVQTRPRERGDPDLVREEIYVERGKGAGPRAGALVLRPRDADDNIEDIPRGFPPPGGRDRDDRRSTYRSDYYESQRPRRAKSVGRRYSDEETDYAGPAAAAGAAGYAAGRRKERERRRRRDDRDYDSEYSDSPPRSERRKSGIQDFIGGLGLGGLAGALTGKKDRDRSESRSVRSGRSGRSRSRVSRRRHYSSEEGSRSRSRSGGDKTERKWAQAAQAALVAGAIEAFISRKAPGPWTGDKGKRIATAAIGAGGFDAILDRDPDKKTKRHLAEAVIGGVGANRLVNGAPSKSRGRDMSASPDRRSIRSRSRSVIDRFRGRSQSRGRSVAGDEGGGGGGGSGAIKSLAAGGALAAAGKAIYDRVRSKSRKRRSPSSSSADSYVPSRNRRRDMRRSQNSDTESTRRGPATGRNRAPGSRAIDNNSDAGTNNQVANIEAGGKPGEGGEKNGNESDSSSTTDLEQKRKGMRGKELLTAGLATVATIHAVHGVYSSMEAHEKRHKMVAEGEMSPEEARKKQTKAWVQDAAAVGIAALGIKGAFSEWKEMKEQREEIHKLEKRKRDRQKKLQQREKREQQERNDAILKMAHQNPQLAYMQNNMGQMGQGGYSGMMPQMPMYSMPQAQVEAPRGQAPQADQSGNPYAPRDGGGRN